jgi:asparagine synthase (glutamine-hydrolysing)
MCGIAGWGRSDPGTVDSLRLARMCDVQRHRGPDDAGMYLSADGKVALGHRRLTIIDLSPQGHQPMTNEDGTAWITYNGEIYNFRLLRRELEGLGHSFRSETDTEVILHSYEEWGIECLEKFNGMFAFGLYDSRKQSLILVRDRFGVKPLYYTWDDTTLFFASDIKALLASGIRPRFQREHVAELFLFSALTGDRTLFKGVKSLRPGTTLTLSLLDGTWTLKPFYIPHTKVDFARYSDTQRLSIAELEEQLGDLLLKSVEQRLISDVPVGTLCSGGLDSSLITAMARASNRDVRLFNVSSKGFANMDEAAYARTVARHLGADLIVYEVERKDLQRGFVDATYFNDNPLSIINAVPMFYLSALARSHGVKVLLSGEGADELFGGYDWRHLALLRGLRWQRCLAALPRPLRKLFATIAAGGDGIHKHRFKTRIGNVDDAIQFISGSFERAEERRRDVEAYNFIADPVIRQVMGAMLSDLREYLEPLLLRQDHMTMAASVECREPFLNQTVAEFAFNLPLKLKLRANRGKWILKRVAERYLPREIIYRPKQGFPIPAAAFLYDQIDFSIFANGFWENYFGLTANGCREAILEAGREGSLWYHLLMFEVWGRIFLNNEHLEAIKARAFLDGQARTVSP